MANKIVGSLKKLMIAGMSFNVIGESNITEIGSKYENDVIVTSGENLRKMTKRAETREGIEISCDGTERDLLRDIADGTEDVTLSYELANGDVYRSNGWIEFESRETGENKASVKLFPRDDWQSFLAS